MARLISDRPLAAPSIASAAPDDVPYRCADPPAGSTTAAMSSISRWTA
jgi:hypothetical protein